MDRLDQILHICKVIAHKHGESIAAIGNEVSEELAAAFEEAGIEKFTTRESMVVDSEYLTLAEEKVERLLTNCLLFAINFGWSAEDYLSLYNSV